MAEIYVRENAQQTAERVSSDNPFPVKMLGDDIPAPAGRTVTCKVQVPGIGAAADYTSGDAFGTMITFENVFRPEKMSGVIVRVFMQDFDDEGLQKDLVLFTRPFTGTADNSAFAVGDVDAAACVGVIVIDSFVDCGGFRIGQEDPGIWVSGESTNLYAQLITRGADNIAAGAVPNIAIVVVPD
jgi:hypothetical protein